VVNFFSSTKVTGQYLLSLVKWFTSTMFGNETSVQTFADSGFSNKLLQGLSSLRQNEKFFDMMICVGDMQFPCHRVVLAASSNYFRFVL